MKAAEMLMLLVCLCSGLRAEWKDLKPGMDQRTAAQCVGTPLIQSRGRGGAEAWTYDCSGYIHFRYGRVSYWQAPKPARATTGASLAQKTPPPAKPKPSRKATIALSE